MKVALVYCLWDNIKPRTFAEALGLASSGLVHTVVVSMGSLLPYTRNKALMDTYNLCPDFTHVLMIDGDMVDLSTECIQALITADKDLITPVMTKRVPPFSPALSEESYPALFKELEKPQPDRQPIPVLSTGFGCVLIKRHVLDDLLEKTDGNGVVWFPADRQVRLGFDSEVQNTLKEMELREFPESDPIKLLQKVYIEGVAAGVNAHVGSIIFGEDIEFCARMRKKGMQPFVHTGQYISHLGDQGYNLKDFIDYCEMEKKEGVISRPEASKVSVWQINVPYIAGVVHGA